MKHISHMKKDNDSKSYMENDEWVETYTQTEQQKQFLW